jgi:hypothetical protein
MNPYIFIPITAYLGACICFTIALGVKVFRGSEELKKRYKRMERYRKTIQVPDELKERALRTITMANDFDLGKSFDRMKAGLLASILN